ncbi:MAG: methionine--tRNA ligase [Candidatus Nomurabacteria bacterium]|jgi:methionyl-tRNA synthetase|nr:methionine--tRNA ligase [Candidatus Nomurabacteria bacterium]
MSKKYITSAIPYVNAKPHIGHAMDYLLADIWARYQAGQGNEVRYSAGTDEHGTKVEQKAREADAEPQAYVDELHKSFTSMVGHLNVSVTDFVRTTDTNHQRRVQEIWRKLDKAGLIYKDTYEGWYCVGCEGFVTETEAKNMNYTCTSHQKPLERLSEENYYLRVSKFTDEIRRFNETAIVPAFRGREILDLIKDGAQDVSISRPKEKLSWGIAVPDDDSQVMYVWVDALSNYITALGYPDKDWAADFWPADVEVIGKDILRFHSIIWPAILLGLGLKLPKKLLVHGFVNADGVKMSKSIGNVIDPMEIIDQYGAEAFRYFFARHIPTFDDGDFTWQKFLAAYNGELANDLGNLVSRTANMLKRFVGGSTRVSEHFSWDSSSFNQFMADFRFDMALGEVWNLAQHLNQYIDEQKPWEVAKSTVKQSSDITQVMSYLVSGLLEFSKLLTPFLPDTAAKIDQIFGGDSVGEAPILFPKAEK